MCLLISVIAFVLAINLLLKTLYLYALFSFLVGLFFAIMMIKNILYVKNKKDKKHDNH